VTATPKLAPKLIPAPTLMPTAIPTQTPTFETVLPQAWPLCKAAFSSTVSSGTLVTVPMLTLRTVEYQVTPPYYPANTAARHQSGRLFFPHIEALAVADTRTLVCIKQTTIDAGAYRPSQFGSVVTTYGYQLKWDVRLVQWPSGQVVAETSLTGSKPPEGISFEPGEIPKEAYGDEPSKVELFKWLLGVLGWEQTQIIPSGRDTVAFSPDGQTLALDNGWSVELWRVSDGTLVRTLKGHDHSVSSVAFSPDGQTLASGSEDKTVRLWRVSDGTLLRTLEGHSKQVMSVALSPDGQILASGSCDKTVRLWQVSDGTLLYSLQLGINPATRMCVPSVAFSPDGQILASGAEDRTVKLWRVSDGTLLGYLGHEASYVGYDGEVATLAFSPDGQTLALNAGATVRLWRVSDGTLVRTLEGHTSYVYSVAFSPDGQTLASGSKDRTVRLWRVSDGTLLHTLEGHSKEVNSVAFSPDGHTVASAAADGTVRLWHIP
jgi:hypothetical protein